MAPATLLKSLEGCNGDIRDAVLSPDNSLLAIRSSNGRCINIYDVNSGSLQARTTSHENMIWDLSFSGSNKYVLSACDDGIARLFSTATGALERRFSDEKEGWSDQRMFVARFTPDAKAIATGTDIVQVWDVETGELVRELIGPRDRDVLPVASIEAMDSILQNETTIGDIDFSPDGKYLVSMGSGGWGCMVRLWDMQSWELKFESLGNGLSFSVNGSTFAVAGNKQVKVLHAETMTLQHTLQGSKPVFSPDGNIIATSSPSHTVHLWDAQTGNLIHTLSGYGTATASVLFTPDSTTLLSNSGRVVHIWYIKSGDLESLLEGHGKNILAMTLSPNGKMLATGSKDCSVRLWNTKTGDCLQMLGGHSDEVWGVAFSGDGKRLVSSDDGGTVLLWEVDLGRAHTVQVQAVSRRTV
jgi:WD40 repeat protein